MLCLIITAFAIFIRAVVTSCKVCSKSSLLMLPHRRRESGVGSFRFQLLFSVLCNSVQASGGLVVLEGSIIYCVSEVNQRGEELCLCSYGDVVIQAGMRLFSDLLVQGVIHLTVASLLLAM